MSGDKELAERVYAVVQGSDRPLRAQEIVARVSRLSGRRIDKAAVNGVLYGSLRGRVHQNKNYAWYVRNGGLLVVWW